MPCARVVSRREYPTRGGVFHEVADVRGSEWVPGRRGRLRWDSPGIMGIGEQEKLPWWSPGVHRLGAGEIADHLDSEFQIPCENASDGWGCTF